jgi:hypothetical protein
VSVKDRTVLALMASLELCTDRMSCFMGPDKLSSFCNYYVVEVVTPSRGKPSRHGRVGGVSRNVHMDLAALQPKLTVRAATVRGKPRVAEAVQHVPKQDRKPRAVQPVTTEPSVGSKGGVGVVIHLSKTMEK